MSKPKFPFSAHFGATPPWIFSRKYFFTARAARDYVYRHADGKDKIAVLLGTFYEPLPAIRPFHVFKIR